MYPPRWKIGGPKQTVASLCLKALTELQKGRANLRLGALSKISYRKPALRLLKRRDGTHHVDDVGVPPGVPLLI